MKLNLLRKDGKSQKSLLMLTLFFGIFGVDYFYLGQKTLGIVKLFFSWFGLTFLAFSLIIIASTIADGEKIIPYAYLPDKLQADINGVLAFSFMWVGVSFIWNIYNLFIYLNLDKFQDKYLYLGKWGATQKEVFENLLILE